MEHNEGPVDVGHNYGFNEHHNEIVPNVAPKAETFVEHCSDNDEEPTPTLTMERMITFLSREIFPFLLLLFEQVLLMCTKHCNQKQRNGRQFWKETFMIQFFTLSFTTGILYLSSQPIASTSYYGLLSLPPLSEKGPTAVFNQTAVGNTISTVVSRRLYYAPNTHPGVNQLIDSLTTQYPDIDAVGTANYEEVLTLYQENLFDTWIVLLFTLDDAQLSSGSLIPSENTTNTVSYSILVNPTNWGASYPTYNYTMNIYNKLSTDSDLFWNTGYLTLQNYIATYLSKQYSNVESDFKVSQ